MLKFCFLSSLLKFILILDDIDSFVLCLPRMLLIIVKAPWGHIRLFGQPKNFRLSQMNITKVRTQVKSKCSKEKVTMEGCLLWTTLQILSVKGEGRTSFLSKTINDFLFLKFCHLRIKMRSSLNVNTISSSHMIYLVHPWRAKFLLSNPHFHPATNQANE